MPKSGQRGGAEQKAGDDVSLAAVLAANIKELMKHSLYRERLGSNPKLGSATKLGSSAIHRVRAGHNATLETLEALAKAFDLEPWQLLVPINDPKNPPALKTLSEAEVAFYAKIDEAERALKALKEGA
jgi:hypothetical protein